MAGKSFKKVLSNNMSWVWTALFLVAVLCICLAIIGIILGGIALKNTKNLDNDKQSKAPFTDWITINTTLYKNAIIDNIILLEDVPIRYTQIGRQLLVRLPLLIVDDTLAGTLSFFTLHVTDANRIPLIFPDELPWGSSSSVSLSSTAIYINNPVDDRTGDVYAIELGVDGQAFVFDMVVGYLPAPANSNVLIRGNLHVYETVPEVEMAAAVAASKQKLSHFSTTQIINSVINGESLKK
jgi:hypothetical protein